LGDEVVAIEESHPNNENRHYHHIAVTHPTRNLFKQLFHVTKLG